MKISTETIKQTLKEGPEEHVWKIRAILNGGPGSGNWGHIGIPGYRGGSQAGSGGSFARPDNYMEKKGGGKKTAEKTSSGADTSDHSWETPSGNKLTMTLAPEKEDISDGWGGSVSRSTGTIDVQSMTFNGEPVEGKLGTLQHKDKVIFKVKGKEMGAVLPPSARNVIKEYYEKKLKATEDAFKSEQERQRKLRDANGPHGERTF